MPPKSSVSVSCVQERCFPLLMVNLRGSPVGHLTLDTVCMYMELQMLQLILGYVDE